MRIVEGASTNIGPWGGGASSTGACRRCDEGRFVVVIDCIASDGGDVKFEVMMMWDNLY
jgi:hypothetical protein